MIPFYKQVILMSFSCEHCGFENNEIQPGGEIQEKGIRITLKVTSMKDLNRRIVKSDFSKVRLDELDFEIPSQTQKGEVTTVEGIFERSITGLEQDQDRRRIDNPEAAKTIDDFVVALKKLRTMETPFTLIIEDISGNSAIENLNAPHPDHECSTKWFNRTLEQDHLLGIFTNAELNEVEKPVEKVKKIGILEKVEEGEWTLEELHGEVLRFPTNCPECLSPAETNMKVTSIPHFKDVVIMSTNCDACGAKTNEVKSGGGINELGTKIEVTVNGKEDFSRDVLKSDACSLSIVELDCEVGPNALGGRFTTVEGILSAMKTQLQEMGGMFQDSEDIVTKKKMSDFISELNEVLEGKRKVTLVLDDPSGNSYVQSLRDDGENDERLKITKYTRNFDQMEELGLNDMVTENY